MEVSTILTLTAFLRNVRFLVLVVVLPVAFVMKKLLQPTQGAGSGCGNKAAAAANNQDEGGSNTGSTRQKEKAKEPSANRPVVKTNW